MEWTETHVIGDQLCVWDYDASCIAIGLLDIPYE